ncbi:hypothetical protein HAX54_003425 [Datura stramonium]|uniref:Uncharacterized protein n=1 Tax=Datura stramonium TaxID=4076 RepID=A0ABS8T5B7_DATST|nr:hypothetical protein [Datura stramonium]
MTIYLNTIKNASYKVMIFSECRVIHPELIAKKPDDNQGEEMNKRRTEVDKKEMGQRYNEQGVKRKIKVEGSKCRAPFLGYYRVERLWETLKTGIQWESRRVQREEVNAMMNKGNHRMEELHIINTIEKINETQHDILEVRKHKKQENLSIIEEQPRDKEQKETPPEVSKGSENDKKRNYAEESLPKRDTDEITKTRSKPTDQGNGKGKIHKAW